MYLKFRLFLTLLVFVSVEILNANEADDSEIFSDTKNVSLPIELQNEEKEIEAKTIITTVDETPPTTIVISDDVPKARSIAGNYGDIDDINEAPNKDTTKTFKNIFRGIYKSYKSTYMGNATSAEYKKRLIDRLNAASSNTAHILSTASIPATQKNDTMYKINEKLKNQTSLTNNFNEQTPFLQLPPDNKTFKVNSIEKQHKRKRKYTRRRSSVKRTKLNNHFFIIADNTTDNSKNNNNSNSAGNINNSINNTFLSSNNNEFIRTTINELHDKHYAYTIGPGVNISFDMLNDIVNVNLDGDNLREIMRGRWLNDNTEEGRGKKYDMVTKVLPLFVLPFLIQSAIVPFLVTKLKLLLVKSILVGKLAIFLIIISAIRNSNKMVQSYEVAPSYWAGEPSRRSELAAAAATSPTYNGYRVEGKPAAWIN